jgi:hypothetical protein
VTRHGRAHVFAIPALIAAASLVGLFSALLGDGMADALAWAGLAVAPAATAWARFSTNDKSRRARPVIKGKLRT